MTARPKGKRVVRTSLPQVNWRVLHQGALPYPKGGMTALEDYLKIEKELDKLDNPPPDYSDLVEQAIRDHGK